MPQACRYVDPEALWVDGQPSIVEQPVDISSEKQTAVSMVDAKFGIAVQMSGLEHAGWGLTGQGTGLALGPKQMLAELPLSPADADDI